MSFWQFFRKGWDGRALLLRPLKNHHSIWKILFVWGVKWISRKTGGQNQKVPTYSFMLKYSNITVWYAMNENVKEWKCTFVKSVFDETIITFLYTFKYFLMLWWTFDILISKFPFLLWIKLTLVTILKPSQLMGSFKSK